ncbi:MAG: hypothetical protein QOG97_3018 [Acidimicrobiaceae bacterium]|nr:hypothetical protein [Acidimicrobiaceae bacterium]MDQ1442790.1 hypothetical protein [Acidimicrobiaceae bacterium]
MGRQGRMPVWGLIAMVSIGVMSGCGSSPSSSPSCRQRDGATVCLKYRDPGHVSPGDYAGPATFELSAHGLKPGSALDVTQRVMGEPDKAVSIGIADSNGTFPSPINSGLCDATQRPNSCGFVVLPNSSPETVVVTVTSTSGATVTGSFVLKSL